MSQALRQPGHPAQAGAPTPRILLVSQSIDERETYARAFRAEGYCTLLASTRSEACRLAAELPPSAIIIDVGEWDWFDGIAMIQAMKAEPRLRRVPVIILTGRSLAGDREVAARAGCDLFISKPCLPDALAHIVCGIARNSVSA
jgi:two-component system, cell cycle response regulator DivK